MDSPAAHTVTTVADARAGLSRTLKTFRKDPAAQAVVLGSHRKPEAVLLPFALYEDLVAHSGRPDRLLDSVLSKRALILQLAAASRAKSLALFGSVAKGTDTDASDIDFLADLDDGASLFDIAQLEIDLEQLLSRRIDIVIRSGLDAQFLAQIDDDVMEL
jgi:predicted nucleotidyltransferase